MKIMNFPKGYEAVEYIIWNNSIKFFLSKGNESLALYDPIKDQIFGNIWENKQQQNNNKFKLPGISQSISFRIDTNLHIENIPVIHEAKLYFDIRVYHCNKQSNKRVFFNPIDNDYRFTEFDLNDTHYIFNTFQTNLTYNETVFWIPNYVLSSLQCNFDVIVQIKRISKLIAKGTITSCDHLAIIKPQYSSGPTIFKIPFQINNVIQCPNEPMVVVNNKRQYAVIDLEL